MYVIMNRIIIVISMMHGSNHDFLSYVWVILRGSVTCVLKKRNLVNFFPVKVSRYGVIWTMAHLLSYFFTIRNIPNRIRWKILSIDRGCTKGSFPTSFLVKQILFLSAGFTIGTAVCNCCEVILFAGFFKSYINCLKNKLQNINWINLLCSHQNVGQSLVT